MNKKMKTDDPSLKHSGQSAPDSQAMSDENIKRIAEEVVIRIKRSKDLPSTIKQDILGIQKSLKLHHKIIYLALIFLGVVLVWYGAWTIVAQIPVLNNPVVAIVIGVILLIFTGTIYKELI